MKYLFLIILLFSTTKTYASFSQEVYVALPNGIKVYEKPDTNSRIVTSLDYGQVIIMRLSEYKDSITINGFETNWAIINNGQGANGYFIYAFVSTIPPPEKSVNTFKDYAMQLSGSIIDSIDIWPGEAYSEFDDFKKYIYKNGLSTTVINYENAVSQSITIPNITLENAYIILAAMFFRSQPTVSFPVDNSKRTVKEDEGSSYKINRDLSGKITSLEISRDNEAATNYIITTTGRETSIVYSYRE